MWRRKGKCILRRGILVTDRCEVGSVEVARVWIGGQLARSHRAWHTCCRKVGLCSQGNQANMVLRS